MEERANLLRGLSLAVLKEAGRVQSIQKDVKRRFEARWLQASTQSLMQREGEEFLRTSNSMAESHSQGHTEVAELDWMLSTLDTMPLEDRIRIEKRLQERIRVCEDQLRGMVGLPMASKRPLKRQRIKTQSSAQKQIISQFSKEGILRNLEHRLSKASNRLTTEYQRSSSVFKQQAEEGNYPDTQISDRQSKLDKQYSPFRLPDISKPGRLSIGLRKQPQRRNSRELLIVSERLGQLLCNTLPQKRLIGGKKCDRQAAAPSCFKSKQRVPTQPDRRKSQRRPTLKQNREPTKLELKCISQWRRPSKREQPPPSRITLNLGKSRFARAGDLSPRSRQDQEQLYESLQQYESIYSQLHRETSSGRSESPCEPISKLA